MNNKNRSFKSQLAEKLRSYLGIEKKANADDARKHEADRLFAKIQAQRNLQKWQHDDYTLGTYTGYM